MRLVTVLLIGVLILFSGASCGLAPGVVNVDPVFQPQIDWFKDEAAKRGKAFELQNITISFGQIRNQNFQGLCRSGTGHNKIIINQEAYERSTDLERFNIIAHELGHCQLGLEHDDRVGEDGLPLSLMFPNKLWHEFLAERFDDLMDNFFPKNTETLGSQSSELRVQVFYLQTPLHAEHAKARGRNRGIHAACQGH